ncbi:MAG: TIGR02453 family protein [Acidimicrobiia bacterium]|nr:TIGR02453 family protein [Acidimicrobiia bacterium]
MPMRHFTPGLFAFLRDLAEHNDRAWFKANQTRYEEQVRLPALAFIEDLADPLLAISRHLTADPRPLGGSLFRIQRDTRFSKDKTPYKTHTGIHLRHVATRDDVHAPGFYLHLEPGNCFAAPYAMGEGNPLVRPPQGFAPDHPLLDDLRRRDFTASTRLTQARVTAPGFLEDYAATMRAGAPFLRFLCQAVDLAF